MMSRRVSLAVALLSVVLSICTLAGCGEEGPKLPPMGPVSGAVTLDGQPMATGEVVFSLPGMPESRLPVTNGAFSGEAMIGSNTVGVFSYIEMAPDSGLDSDTVKKVNVVANRFSYQTQLTAEIKAEGNPELKFDVSTR